MGIQEQFRCALRWHCSTAGCIVGKKCSVQQWVFQNNSVARCVGIVALLHCWCCCTAGCAVGKTFRVRQCVYRNNSVLRCVGIVALLQCCFGALQVVSFGKPVGETIIPTALWSQCRQRLQHGAYGTVQKNISTTCLHTICTHFRSLSASS